jgi:hypothetical protein
VEQRGSGKDTMWTFTDKKAPLVAATAVDAA